MSKKFIWAGVMATTAIPVLGAASLTLFEIFHNDAEPVDVEVATEKDLLDAINNPEYDSIGLTDDITISDLYDKGQSEGLYINRDFTIVGEGNTLSFVDKKLDGGWDPTVGIRVDAQTNDPITVNFKNLDIEFKTVEEYNAAVYLEDINGCTVNFDNCQIKSIQDNTSYKSYAGIWIGPKNVNYGSGKEGSHINVQNSDIQGWTAVYNQGSNITFESNSSRFVGENHHSESSNDFATIIAADFPYIPISSHHHNFSSHNHFTFNECNIVAQTKGGARQYAIENRCLANNIVDLNDSSWDVKVKDNDFAFVWAIDDKCDYTFDKWLEQYQGLDKPEVIKSYADLMNYYGNTEPLSVINVDGEAAKDKIFLDDTIEDAGGVGTEIGAPVWGYTLN